MWIFFQVNRNRFRHCLLPISLLEMSFPMELFLLMGLDYTKDKELGRRCHKMRCELEFNMEKAGLRIPRLLRKTMDALNVGREVTVYARKT